MPLRLQLLLALMVPVLVVAGFMAMGRPIPVPHLGRGYVIRVALPDLGKMAKLPKIYGPEDRSRPLVLIDAGHGGKDPGASGGVWKEKNVVLNLALSLRDELVKNGGVRVALSREDDTFIPLDERPELARRMDADLFISIHADSAGGYSSVTGSSIYTLSDASSSMAAARFARRENSGNILNGVEVDRKNKAINDILVELAQRRVQEKSNEFASLIIREGMGKLHFHKQPRRQAALAVLKAPDVPAVLYEAGYITNSVDAMRLTSAEGRKDFGEVMAKAIKIYFARQSEEVVVE